MGEDISRSKYGNKWGNSEGAKVGLILSFVREMNFKISSERCGFGSEIDFFFGGCQSPELYRGLGELLWRHREYPPRPLELGSLCDVVGSDRTTFGLHFEVYK